MAEIRETVDIRAPIEGVFTALTDPRRGPEWNPILVDVRDVGPEPTQAGTTWTQTAMVAGRAMNLTCRVTRLEPPRFGILEISGPQSGRITTLCEEVDGVTRVTQTLEFTPPKGLFGQMAGGFVSNALRREIARSMDRQKSILEQEYRDQGGSRTA